MMNQRGVTLVEVVVCLIIISLLSSISVPAFITWSDRLHLKSVTRDLMGSLQQAKLEAIMTNSYVVLGVEDDHYYVFVDDGRGEGIPMDWVRQPDERQIVSNSFGNGIEMTSNFPDDKIRFSGSPGIKAGRFFVSDKNGNQMEVIVSFVGRIRVERS